jgi:N-hydroxyarylamine O-acetyltransferase
MAMYHALLGDAIMNVDAYLERVGHAGPVLPDLTTLFSLHRSHAQAIPYENVDVQLGRRVDLDTERIFDKIVVHGRGGWCFETNGLFQWALSEIGLDVTRMVGGVPGAQADPVDPRGNHLVLRVDLDGPWLADVGLGAAMLEPIPLSVGNHEAGNRTFGLAELGDGHWRFENHEGVRPPRFDFHTAPDEARLSAVSDSLQEDEQSVFHQNLICKRFDSSGTGTVNLIGRVLQRPRRDDHVVDDAAELVEVLGREFGISDPELASLWPAVAARHDELFQSRNELPSRFPVG